MIKKLTCLTFLYFFIVFFLIYELSTANAQNTDTAYGSVVEKYIQAINENWDQQTLKHNGIYTELENYYNDRGEHVPATLNNFGYAVIDLDKDGTNELLIGSINNGAEILDLYTFTGSIPKQLAISATRDLFELSTNGSLRETFAVGSMFAGFAFYTINNKDLRLEYSGYANSMDYTNTRYWYSTSSRRAIDDPNSKEISAKEYTDCYNNYVKNVINYTPFSDYQGSPGVPGSTVTIYRIYNQKSGEHLYTPDQNEVLTLCLLPNTDWKSEDIGWSAPGSGRPVFRLYNRILNDHLYTSDINEVSVLTNGSDWVLDNQGNPLFYSGGNIPIFRLYSPSSARHLLTVDLNEYNILGDLQDSPWTREGEALYAVSSK